MVKTPPVVSLIFLIVTGATEKLQSSLMDYFVL